MSDINSLLRNYYSDVAAPSTGAQLNGFWDQAGAGNQSIITISSGRTWVGTLSVNVSAIVTAGSTTPVLSNGYFSTPAGALPASARLCECTATAYSTSSTPTASATAVKVMPNVTIFAPTTAVVLTANTGGGASASGVGFVFEAIGQLL